MIYMIAQDILMGIGVLVIFFFVFGFVKNMVMDLTGNKVQVKFIKGDEEPYKIWFGKKVYAESKTPEKALFLAMSVLYPELKVWESFGRV